QRHVIAMTLHHLICDGWSMGVLAGEIAESYRALLTGSKPDLPPLAIQYADFACWEQEQAPSERTKVDLDYWERKFGGSCPEFELPTDHPRSDNRGTARRIDLSFR